MFRRKIIFKKYEANSSRDKAHKYIPDMVVEFSAHVCIFCLQDCFRPEEESYSMDKWQS